MKRRYILFVSTFLLLMLAFSTTVNAQTSLSYGSGSVGEITTDAPFAFFSFNGNEGDLVTVRVLGLAPTFKPSVSLNSPAGQQLAFSTGDAYGSGGDARFDVRIPTTGAYNIQVGSTDGVGGQFLIRLDGITTNFALEFQGPMTSTTAVPFNATAPSQVLALNANVNEPLQFLIEGGEVNFAASYYDMDGNLLAVLTPDSDGEARRTLSASDSTYYVVLRNLDGSDQPVNVGLLRLANQAATSDTTTSTDAASPTVAATVCTIITGAGGTNLRTGPSTDYPIITSLAPETSYPVTGQNNNWYTINYNGQTGWLAGSVTTLTGPCGSIAYVEAPAAPQPQATYTQSPDYTPQPDYTQQPDYTPPPPVTTEEAAPGNDTAQVAPEDGSYRYTFDRDNGGAFSEYVSYPGGDNVDLVTLETSLSQTGEGSARDVSVTLMCSGPGSEYVGFSRGGINAQRYSCGQTITYRYTYGFGSENYYVFADGGSATYVNYTLNISTAP